VNYKREAWVWERVWDRYQNRFPTRSVIDQVAALAVVVALG